MSTRPIRVLPLLMLVLTMALATAPPAAKAGEPFLDEFNLLLSEGVLPAGWENSSQPLGLATFRSGETQQGEQVLRVTADANTTDRTKLRTEKAFELGEYVWHLYIPELEAGAQNAIAAFLLSDQSGGFLRSREFDFEIGSGTIEDRARYNIPSGKLMVLMTMQRDTSSGTVFDSVAFQPLDPNDHVVPGAWYTYTIEMTQDSRGRYIASWFIQKDGGPKLLGRSQAISGIEVIGGDFDIFCSSENLLFMGENLPATNKDGYFDSSQYIPNDVQLITDIESDVTSSAFPPGTQDNEWTRFGAAFDSISIGQPTPPTPVLLTTIDSDSTGWDEAAPPNPPLGLPPAYIGAGIENGNDNVWYRLGCSFDGILLESDPTTGPTVFYDARRSGGANLQIGLVIEETDGDIWQDATPHTLTTTMTEYSLVLSSDNLEYGGFVAGAAGDRDFDLDIKLIGFRILDNGDTGTPSVFVDDVEWSTAAAPTTRTLITNMTGDSIGTFPPTFGVAGTDNQWSRFGNAFNVLQFSGGQLQAITDFINGTVYQIRYNVSGASLDMGASINNVVRAFGRWAGGPGPTGNADECDRVDFGPLGLPFWGIRYNLPGVTFDVSEQPAFSYKMRKAAVTNPTGPDPAGPGNPTVRFIIQEDDGEVWESVTEHTVTTSLVTYTTPAINTTNFVKVDGPAADNQIDVTKLTYIGFTFVAEPGQFENDEFTEFVIDEIKWKAPIVNNNDTVVAQANWAAGSWFGVRYNVPSAPIDLSSESILTYRMRDDQNDGPTQGPLVKLQIVDQDGEVWEVNSGHHLTNQFATYQQALDQSQFTRVDGAADNVMNLATIDNIGFIFSANGATSGFVLFQIDDILAVAAPPAPQPAPALPLITSIEDPDSVHIRLGSEGFPPNPADSNPFVPIDDQGLTLAEGSWTRFGFPFSGMHINGFPSGFPAETDAGSSDGNRHLELRAVWAQGVAPAGHTTGIRYLPHNFPIDLSGDTRVSYDIRVDQQDAGTTHTLVVVDDEGDIAIGPSLTVSENYVTHTADIATDLTVSLPSDGDGVLDTNSVAYIGFNFTNANTNAPFQVFSIDNIRQGDGTVVLSVPVSEDFSSGLPTAGWELLSSHEGRIQVVGGQLQMDDTVEAGLNSRNEATVHVNLAGLTNVELSVDVSDFNDEEESMPDSFTLSHRSDGIAVSADGITWHRAADLPDGDATLTIDLDAVIANAQISYTSDFRIRFQQYGNYPKGSDGRGFDNITIDVVP